MAERVQYYLQKHAPELEDLEKKGLFDKKEISIIMRKRTAFEHRINSRGVKAKEFVRYAEYEMNAEALRKKRVSRLGVKDKRGPSEGAGPRRINFIFERAERRYPGDLSLWMHHLDYAKSEKQVHVINKIFTQLLQLHPTKPQVWIMAAKYESEVNASMKAARSIMLRGLRFNYDSGKMWTEYAKLELLYASKLLARRKLMGIKSKVDELEADEENETQIHMPEITSKDLLQSELKELPEADFSKLADVENNKALRGATALVIFDEAVKKYQDPLNLAVDFLQMFDSFKELDREGLCSHVIQYLVQNHPSERTKILDITLPIRHIEPSSNKFPAALKIVIKRFNEEPEKSIQLKQMFRERVILEYVQQDIEPNLKRALDLLDAKLQK